MTDINIKDITDGLEIPTWLRRGHPDCTITAKKTRNHKPKFAVSQSARDRLDRIKALRGRQAREAQSHTPVLCAIRGGADTFGKIRKATDLVSEDDTNLLHTVLRQLHKGRKIEKRAGRYYPR